MISLLSLAVLIGLGGITWALVARHSSTSASSAPGDGGGEVSVNGQVAQADVSFSSEPTSSWTVTPGDFGPSDSQFSDARPYGYSELDGAMPLYGRDVVVVGLAQDDEHGSTLGLDPNSGRLMWSLPFLPGACDELVSSRAVACHDDEHVVFVDERSGEEVGTPQDGQFDAILDDGKGGTVSVKIGRTMNEGGDYFLVSKVQIAHGTLEDLTKYSTMSVSAGEQAITEIFPTQPVSGKIFGRSMLVDIGPAQFLINLDDGSLIDQTTMDYDDAWDVLLKPGVKLRAHGDTIDIFEDSKSLVSRPSLDWDKSEDGKLLSIGGTLFDTATWQPILEANDESELYVLSQAGVVAGENHDWDLNGELLPNSIPFDGRVPYDLPHAVIQFDGSTLSAYTPTADLAWSRTFTTDTYLADDSREYVGHSGSTLVATLPGLITGYTGFSARSTTAQGDTTYETPCGKEPEITASHTQVVDGEIQVQYVFHAVCPDGQWVDGAGVNLQLSNGTSTLASGAFDFSTSPVWLGPDTLGDGEGVPVTVVYPPTTAFATPDELQQALDSNVVIVACEHSTSESGNDEAPSEPTTDVPAVTGFEADPDSSLAEEASLEALQRLADVDRDSVQELEGSWVPQLSAKKNGTFDRIDQHTYNYTDIYAETLRLRIDYPDARLVWSGDYGSFTYPDYWVTINATPYGAPKPVLNWCAQEGFPKSHCYAKRLLTNGPVEGSTRSRR